MDELVGFVCVLVLCAIFWTFALLVPILLAAVAALFALWVGWAYLDRYVQRKAENSNPTPFPEPSG